MNLEDVAKKLKEVAGIPEDIFGGSKNGETVTPTYRQLMLIIHPDKFDGDAARIKIANEAFAQLTELRAAAERKVKAGTYGKRKVSAPPRKEAFHPMVIESKKGRYTLTAQVASGDLADLFLCYLNDSPLATAAFKIVKDGSDNDLIENEAAVLGKLYPPEAKEEKFYRFIPKLLDTLLVKGPGFQRRVNVLSWFPEHRGLDEVMRLHPDGVDFRDMVWMFKRVLHGVGFAHENGIIHGAILPPHVLIHPVDHGAKIVDWSYALQGGPATPKKKKGDRGFYDYVLDDSFLEEPHIKAISSPYRDYYAPEILEKKTPTPATDLYMAAKCAVALVGGDLAKNSMPDAMPKTVQGFFKRCLEHDPKKRPQHAWDAHGELDEILKKAVGKRAYRPFPMPPIVR